MSIVRALSIVGSLAALLVFSPAVSHRHAPVAPMEAPAHASPAPEGAEPDLAAQTAYAQRVLEGLAATYRYLDGVTVTLGVTPNGEEAVAYYEDGRIVVGANHTVGIDAILSHEVWHVIDWRDNRRLDWGEHVPPEDSAAYLRR